MDKRFLVAALEMWIKDPHGINCGVLSDLLLEYIDDKEIKELVDKLKRRCNE